MPVDSGWRADEASTLAQAEKQCVELEDRLVRRARSLLLPAKDLRDARVAHDADARVAIQKPPDDVGERRGLDAPLGVARERRRLWRRL